MWLWKRNGRELDTGVPTEGTQQMWMVWLLSAGTFVATILIVLGLFAGGRWVIHRATTKKSPSTTVATPQKPAPSTPKTPVAPTEPAPKPTPVTPPPTSVPTPTPVTTPAPAPTATAATTPNLVNTGPTSDD